MLITVENWEQLVLGCCVLSLSWDLAEHLGSRRALEKKNAQKGTGSSALKGGFQVWFFGDAFLGAAGGSSEVVSPGACFLFTSASCNEEQFIRTFFSFFFFSPNMRGPIRVIHEGDMDGMWQERGCNLQLALQQGMGTWNILSCSISCSSPVGQCSQT